MDNRHISIQSKGREAFDLAFQLLFDNAPGKRATHYIDHPEKGLCFLWLEGNSGIKLVTPMGWKESADIAWCWLINQPEEKYDEYLDHDGSNSKGFRVYNESWGKIGGVAYAFLAVKPVWAWHGK